MASLIEGILSRQVDAVLMNMSALHLPKHLKELLPELAIYSNADSEHKSKEWIATNTKVQ